MPGCERPGAPARGSGVAAFLDPDGIWCQVVREAPAGATPDRPALFLDRDGVVVDEVDFLHRPEDVRLAPGAAETVAAANRAGVPVVIVSNQSGIGRGRYGWPEFAATQDRILARLAEAGAAVDMVLACPFHAEGRPPYRHPAHPCRKPNPGMLLRAAERLALDRAGSWIVGDRASDLAAGRAAGLAGGLHVLTGYGPGERAAAQALAGEGFRVLLGDTIGAARETVPLLAGHA